MVNCLRLIIVVVQVVEFELVVIVVVAVVVEVKKAVVGLDQSQCLNLIVQSLNQWLL